MKAAIVERYGGPEVVTIQEVQKPSPKPNQVLIRVLATAVNSGDARLRRADPWFVRLVFGFFGPRKKILGVAYAGIIEEIGSHVTTLKVGDRIYGLSEQFMGAHAEYMVQSATTPFGYIPDGMDPKTAAALTFGGTTALHFLEPLQLKNKSMLLIGASGAVGSAVLQIAKDRGAHVTTVASGANEALLRRLGATACIDYTKTNVLTMGKTYDCVFDCVNAIPVNTIESLVNEGGDIILLAGLIKEMWQSRSVKKAKVHIGTAKPTMAQYEELNRLFLEGKLDPVISEIFPLTDIRKAYEIVDSGRKVGTVIISLSP